MHLLSAVVRRVAGASLGTAAAQLLLGPLGIDRYEWPVDPEGHEMAAGHLLLTPRDMAKLGLLFLRNGEWNGEQLIDARYVEAATARQSPSRPFPEGVGYGYLWWVDDLAGPPAFFAGGHGGQYIYVVPALISWRSPLPTPMPRAVVWPGAADRHRVVRGSSCGFMSMSPARLP